MKYISDFFAANTITKITALERRGVLGQGILPSALNVR